MTSAWNKKEKIAKQKQAVQEIYQENLKLFGMMVQREYFWVLPLHDGKSLRVTKWTPYLSILSQLEIFPGSRQGRTLIWFAVIS